MCSGRACSAMSGITTAVEKGTEFQQKKKLIKDNIWSNEIDKYPLNRIIFFFCIFEILGSDEWALNPLAG